MTTSHAPVHRARGRILLAVTLAAWGAVQGIAHAAPVTFAFETLQNGNPYGEGWFTIDDAVFPYPHKVIGAWPDASDVFLDFRYEDPYVGVFGLANVAAVHFELFFDPVSSQVVPHNSLWAFNVASPDNSRFLSGSVNGLGVSTAFNLNTGISPAVQPLEVTFPQQVPEPASLALLAAGLAGALFRRKVRK